MSHCSVIPVPMYKLTTTAITQVDARSLIKVINKAMLLVTIRMDHNSYNVYYQPNNKDYGPVGLMAQVLEDIMAGKRGMYLFTSLQVGPV